MLFDTPLQEKVVAPYFELNGIKPTDKEKKIVQAAHLDRKYEAYVKEVGEKVAGFQLGMITRFITMHGIKSLRILAQTNFAEFYKKFLEENNVKPYIPKILASNDVHFLQYLSLKTDVHNEGTKMQHCIWDHSKTNSENAIGVSMRRWDAPENPLLTFVFNSRQGDVTGSGLVEYGSYMNRRVKDTEKFHVARELLIEVWKKFAKPVYESNLIEDEEAIFLSFMTKEKLTKKIFILNPGSGSNQYISVSFHTVTKTFASFGKICDESYIEDYHKQQVDSLSSWAVEYEAPVTQPSSNYVRNHNGRKGRLQDLQFRQHQQQQAIKNRKGRKNRGYRSGV